MKAVVTTGLVILVLLAIWCTQVRDKAVDGGFTVSWTGSGSKLSLACVGGEETLLRAEQWLIYHTLH